MWTVATRVLKVSRRGDNPSLTTYNCSRGSVNVSHP